MYTAPVMRSRAVKGTYDVLPDRQPAWHHLRNTTRQVLGRAGVREITTPIFEYAEVFDRSVGASADLVVQKEMYEFEDRGGRRLVLRPEFTASVLRAFVEHGMHTLAAPVKLWSLGPAFRAENVQRGRYRQFHQVNCEILGLATPLVDAEAIALLYDLLAALGITGLTVKLGSVGDPDDKEAYNAYLREALADDARHLTPTSRERLRLNPMRILDAKDPGDRALVAPLDRPLDRLGPAAKEHFDEVAAHLTRWNVPFEIDPGIVRGLDYYRRTAFEVHSLDIGAQSALAGGGRYDGLIARLGGPDVPGIGWAMGVERVFDALASQGAPFDDVPTPVAYLVPMDEAAVNECADMARALRDRGLEVHHGYQAKAPAKGLKDADRRGARLAVLRGERERSQAVWNVKDLQSGEQTSVDDAHLAATLEDRR